MGELALSFRPSGGALFGASTLRLKGSEPVFERRSDPGLELTAARPLVGFDEGGSSGSGEFPPAMARQFAKGALEAGQLGTEGGLSGATHAPLITRY